MSVLDSVLEQRDAAVKAYNDHLGAISAPEHTPTAEDESKLADLRSAKNTLEDRVIELASEARKAAEVEEIRKQLTAAANPSISVREARTYGVDSPNSYFADFIRASNPQFHQHQEARERLAQYASEVAGEMRDPNSAEGKRAVRSVREANRESDPRTAQEAIKRAATFIYEQRAGMDTTSGSGGSFVTPQYFVAEYAPYRQFGRVFADQANKQDLPSYGMTIYLPQVTTAAGVSAQASQNSGITEQDPTAGYLSTALTTNAGQVTVSQQLLDRAGPNFAFDKVVFDQLQRAYNLTLDAYVLTQATANAGTVNMTTAAVYGTASLYPSIGKAKAATVDAAGVVLPATHVFFNPINWEWFASQTDTAGRALFTPDYAGAFNALAAGGPDVPIEEGKQGFKIHGLPVFEDGNIPAAGTTNQIIVAHMPEVWFWEGDLVSRVIPQTFAQDLSVLLQVYAYVGCIVRYPAAVQSIRGTGVLASPTF